MMSYWKNIILFRIKSALILKFDSEPVYKKTFLKNKTKSCHDEATGFCDREIPKASSNRNFLSLITIDSVH